MKWIQIFHTISSLIRMETMLSCIMALVTTRWKPLLIIMWRLNWEILAVNSDPILCCVREGAIQTIWGWWTSTEKERNSNWPDVCMVGRKWRHRILAHLPSNTYLMMWCKKLTCNVHFLFDQKIMLAICRFTYKFLCTIPKNGISFCQKNLPRESELCIIIKITKITTRPSPITTHHQSCCCSPVTECSNRWNVADDKNPGAFGYCSVLQFIYTRFVWAV